MSPGSDRNRSADRAWDGCTCLARYSSGSLSVHMTSYALLRPGCHLDCVWIAAVRRDSHVSCSRNEREGDVRSVCIFSFRGGAGFLVCLGRRGRQPFSFWFVVSWFRSFVRDVRFRLLLRSCTFDPHLLHVLHDGLLFHRIIRLRLWDHRSRLLRGLCRAFHGCVSPTRRPRSR